MLYIIDKSWESAAENLAYEYCLLAEAAVSEDEKSILYFWQNKDTVVIGRNQNPYKECDMDYVREEGIELVRRITGGGAVYHDLGNLNYSFVCREKNYDREKVSGYIVDALNSLGISCQLSGRNDITAGETKISGAAFYSKDNAVLHHGTIVINIDTNRMSHCLTPCKAKLNSKGVSSVKARVGNLMDYNKDINVSKVKTAISAIFCKHMELVGNTINIDEKLFKHTAEKLSSDQWILGGYPENYETISGSFSWGNIELGFVLNDDVIEECFINSDSLYPDEINKLMIFLKGKRLTEVSKDYYEYKNSDISEMIYIDAMCLIKKNLING